MIEWYYCCSVANRFLVLMGASVSSIWAPGPSLIRQWMRCWISDVQVIIKTSYPGQALQIVENQVTYPLTTTMLSVPWRETVRGFSQFGDSYVYVIFEDGTIVLCVRGCWSTSTRRKLPAGAYAELDQMRHGCWLDFYQYALVDCSG